MYTSSLLISRRGFTLVELLIGMTIFAVGMTGILAMLHAAIGSSIRSREEIVVANLLREQIELVKNIRNTNLRSYAPWDRVPASPDTTEFTGAVFLIENNYISSTTDYTASSEKSPVSLSKSTIQSSDTDELKFTQSRLYLDEKGRFTHSSVSPNVETKYASYLIMTPLAFSGALGTTIEPRYGDNTALYPPSDPRSTKNQGYILDARVIAKSGGEYRTYDLKTVVTDWQK